MSNNNLKNNKIEIIKKKKQQHKETKKLAVKDGRVKKQLHLKKKFEIIKNNPPVDDQNPNIENNYNSSGLEFEKNLDFSQALNCYDLAIKTNPSYAIAYFNKGNVLFKLNRYHEAKDMYDQTIKYNPHLADAYNNKAFVLEHLERYDEAFHYYEKAFLMDTEKPLYLFNMGNILYKLNKKAECIDYYFKSIDNGYNLASVVLPLGNVLFENNQFEKALDIINKALNNTQTSDPDPDIYFLKAKVLEKLERYEDSIQAFNISIDLDPCNLDAVIGKNAVKKKLEERIKDEENTCSICMTLPREVILVPCSHKAICKSCKPSVEDTHKCPICRQEIKYYIDKVYL